jgi:hypothetical protein
MRQEAVKALHDRFRSEYDYNQWWDPGTMRLQEPDTPRPPRTNRSRKMKVEAADYYGSDVHDSTRESIAQDSGNGINFFLEPLVSLWMQPCT